VLSTGALGAYSKEHYQQPVFWPDQGTFLGTV
jgi:hypothetical protein